MRQTQIATATSDAEVHASATTVQLGESVRTLMESIAVFPSTPTLFCDNRSSLCLMKGEGSWKSKTTLNKLAYIRQLIATGALNGTYIETTLQKADALTKLLGGVAHARALVQLCLRDSFMLNNRSV